MNLAPSHIKTEVFGRSFGLALGRVGPSNEHIVCRIAVINSAENHGMTEPDSLAGKFGRRRPKKETDSPPKASVTKRPIENEMIEFVKLTESGGGREKLS